MDGALTVTITQALFKKPGHGKLLIDDNLYPKGYASNVNEAYVTSLNLASQSRIASYAINTTNAGAPINCAGTHSLVLSLIHI